LHQENEWYDKRNVEELPSKVSSQLKDIEYASGRSMCFIVFGISLCCCHLTGTMYMGAAFAC